MKKLKVLIASMLGAIALVFACVVGTRVNAAEVSCAKSDTLSTVVSGNTYVLLGSTVSTGSNVTGNSDTTITDKYTVFQFAGNKWGMYTSSEKGSTVNGIAARKSDNICTISISLKAGQSVVFGGYYYSTDTSKTGEVKINDGTTSTTWFNCSTTYFTTKQVSVEQTSSKFTAESDTTYTLIFDNKCGFTTITATITNSNDKNVEFFVDGESYATKTIASGKVEVPSDPVKEGCTFNGWLNEDGSAFTNSGLTDSIKVYADFSRNELTASYKNVYSLNANSLTAETLTDNTENGIFELIADSTNTIVIDSTNLSMDGIQFDQRIKLGGTGDTTKRTISFTISESFTLTVYGMSAKSGTTRTLMISDGTTATELLSNSGNSLGKATKELTAGTYYLYSSKDGFNICGVYLSTPYYSPCVSLSVDANNNNTKVRVTAAIDNVNIVSKKVNGIASMQYTIEGTTWSKDITNVYSSVDAADSGFYRTKDYTVYAIVVFDGYNKVKADFDVTFTVTLAGGQTVTKTITVVKPSA